MTDADRLYRASDFDRWMQHGRAYAAAARKVARRNRRTDSKQEPTDVGRIEHDATSPKEGHSIGGEQCRRIEPDHVAELDRLLNLIWQSYIEQLEARGVWEHVKAELLALREQAKGGDV